jgi:hypothetical protein
LEPADISTRFASAYWHPGLRGTTETARIGNEGAPTANLGDLELGPAKLSGELAVDGKRPTNRPRGALSC